MVMLPDPNQAGFRVAQTLVAPFSLEVVPISMAEGFKALAQRPPEADGCRRYAVGKDGKHHAIKMTYCDNDQCETAIPRAPNRSYIIVESTTRTTVGVRVQGGAQSLKLRLCAACKNAQYCCKACQKRHWPGHKLLCDALKKRRELDKAEAQAAAPRRGADASLPLDWRGLKGDGLHEAIVVLLRIPL